MQKKKLVVITGASSGIGEATARQFSEAGFPLLLLARRSQRLEKLGLANAMVASVDVTDLNSFQAALEKATSLHGPIEGLVNNAGVMLLGQAKTQSISEWKQMLDVNVVGLLNGIHLVLNSMVETGRGTIINISSIAGKKTFPNHVVYCGTKFAVQAISENLREEVAHSNVRVITIAPGAVETELLSHTTSTGIKSDYESWKKSMGGALSPEDVARTILFAYQQPQEVCLREIVLAATGQGA